MVFLSSLNRCLLSDIVEQVLALLGFAQIACTLLSFLLRDKLTLLAVFGALRVYALWAGSRLRLVLVVLVLVLGCVPVATNAVCD